MILFENRRTRILIEFYRYFYFFLKADAIYIVIEKLDNHEYYMAFLAWLCLRSFNWVFDISFSSYGVPSGIL